MLSCYCMTMRLRLCTSNEMTPRVVQIVCAEFICAIRRDHQSSPLPIATIFSSSQLSVPIISSNWHISSRQIAHISSPRIAGARAYRLSWSVAVDGPAERLDGPAERLDGPTERVDGPTARVGNRVSSAQAR